MRAAVVRLEAEDMEMGTNADVDDVVTNACQLLYVKINKGRNVQQNVQVHDAGYRKQMMPMAQSRCN